jgi:phage gpG-like protein
VSIEIRIEGKEKLVVAGNLMLSRSKALKMRILQEMDGLGQRLVRTAKRDYLSGPRPDKLGVVTGRLRASIAYMIDDEGDNNLALRFGTNVIYGRIHELGGSTGRHGSVQIKARPFLAPSFAGEFPRFKDRLAALLTAASGGPGAEMGVPVGQ